MASAGATEKEREFLRWKRKQDQLRAQQAEVRRMEQQQQQRFAGKRREKAMVSRRQPPPRAYPATFLHQQQPNPPRKGQPYYNDDGELFGNPYAAQRRCHSVCDSVDSAAFADAEPSPSRTFGDDDDADTEEDELMRMIMEKEQQEAEAEANAIAAVKATTRSKKEQRFQVPQRNVQRPSAAVQFGEDFYSPVRPVDPETGSSANGHAPFRGARVVTESHRYQQRSPVFGEQRQPQQQQQEQRAKFVDFHPTQSNSDVTSNQIDHELPPLVEDRGSKRKEEQRLQNEDDVWEHFLYGTGAADAPRDAVDDRQHRQKQSLGVPKNKKNHNIFREEISLSQSRSTSLDSGFPTTNESINITSRHQEGQSQPSGSYSNESIPNVSYSPPMSPVASSSKNSSARWRQSSSSFNQSQQGAGGGDGNRNADGNRDSSGSLAGQQQYLQSPTIFPFWSVAFLVSCVVVGVSGFFIEDVMDLVGKFAKTASTLTLSKEEQKQMHTRLEQLQSEIHGFRYTASEIEVHSQKVFAEVKAHLDRMKSEREKHQEMITKEMNDLRGYMLHMMSDMVEQERELIHTRLKHVAAEKVTKTNEKVLEDVGKRAQDILLDDSKKDNSSNHSGKIEETTKRQPVEEQAKSETPRFPPPPVVDVSTIIEIESPPAVAVGEANATLRVEPIRPATALTRGEGVMLMSWELLMMLTAMSILGGFVGLRVRNMNRRKRWYEQRRIRRHIQAQLEQERAARVLAEEDDGDEDDSEEVEGEGDEDRTGDDDSEDWDDGATESSIETVSLMKRATGLTPNSKQRRAAASSEDDEEDEEADGDEDDDGSEDDGIEAIGIRERKTAEVSA